MEDFNTNIKDYIIVIAIEFITIVTSFAFIVK